MIRPAEALSPLHADLAARDFAATPAAPARPRALRAMETADPEQEARAHLVLRLAADRLRELRDDGVTFGYIARMYDVPPETITRLYDDLVKSRGDLFRSRVR
jgi:hypothetical protein